MTDDSNISRERVSRPAPGTSPRRGWALLALFACSLSGGSAAAQQPAAALVTSSDARLAEMAAAMLPALAERSGLELRAPVRLEMRTEDELVRYLEFKLDEELPPEEARAMVDTYGLLGLVPRDMDLRSVLMALYTEQVAGFYEPDSTALFVMEGAPEELVQGVLIHELVHAVQDQWADLDSITDPAVGNDRATAAQAAIEGHATLVMLEYTTEMMQGVSIDLSQIPDFIDRVRPALRQGMSAQYPQLAGAPLIIQEGMLFPYLEGAGFVQRMWLGGERAAPFGERLPVSTEQILGGSAADAPIELRLTVTGAEVVDEDVLGRMEVGVLLEEHLGPDRSGLADGWGGDRYVLVERADGERGLVWFSVWDDAESRDAFADALEGALGSLGGPATLERTSVDGRPAAALRVGSTDGVTVVPGLAHGP